MITRQFIGLSLWLFVSSSLWAVTDPFVEMAEELCANIKTRGLHRVSVADFDSQDPSIGREIQEQLISAIVQGGAVSLVKRDHLEKVKRKLRMDGRGIDLTVTDQADKVPGVDGLVLGSLTNKGKGIIEVHARLVETETGEVLRAVTRDFQIQWRALKWGELPTLFVKECDRITMGLMETPDPLAEMANELSEMGVKRGRLRVAVSAFEPVNNQGVVGIRLAQERLVLALVNGGAFAVVERTLWGDVKNELTLDETATKQLGRMLGADVMVLGTLVNRGNRNLEAHVRLVSVETGEVIKVVKWDLKQDWVESDQLAPPPSDSLNGWKLPPIVVPALSSSSALGTVLYTDSSLVESDSKIIKVTLIEEDSASATIDVEYFLSQKPRGGRLKIYSEPYCGFDRDLVVLSGHRTIRIRISAELNRVPYMVTSHLLVFLRGSGNTISIPFSKRLIKPDVEPYFRIQNPTMRISRVDPPLLFWKREFTLYGEFNESWNKKMSCVVIGAPHYRRYLKIRKWRKDRIVVCSPKSGIYDEWRGGRIFPDSPLFLFVVNGSDGSNDFQIKIDPEGLPK